MSADEEDLLTPVTVCKDADSSTDWIPVPGGRLYRTWYGAEGGYSVSTEFVECLDEAEPVILDASNSELVKAAVAGGSREHEWQDEPLETLASQVDRLATFILGNVDYEPRQSDGAVDTAMRVMAEQSAEIADLEKKAKTLGLAVAIANSVCTDMEPQLVDFEQKARSLDRYRSTLREIVKKVLQARSDPRAAFEDGGVTFAEIPGYVVETIEKSGACTAAEMKAWGMERDS